MGKEGEPPMMPDDNSVVQEKDKKKKDIFGKKRRKFCIPDEIKAQMDADELMRQGGLLSEELEELGEKEENGEKG